MRNLRSVTLPSCVRGFSAGAFDNCPLLERVTISGGGTGMMDPSAYFWEIGEYAFLGCVSLKHVDIPDGVWTIRWRAFCGCASLESVDIPASVEMIESEAFYGCSSLTSVSLPGGVMGLGSDGTAELIGGVRTIGDRAFAECRGLTRIEIPNSVKDIGDGAFGNSYGLRDLVVPRSVFCVWDGANDRWVGRDFGEVFGLDPDANGKQYQYAWETVVLLDIPPTADYEDVPGLPIITRFRDMPNLRSVTLPGCVRGIESYAFYGLPQLESVTISGDTVADSSLPSDWSIGEWAFYGCVNLTHVDIPDGLWAIQRRAFYGCSSLTSVNIPASVEWIADEAFYGCSSLTGVMLPGGATSFGSGEAESIGGVRVIGDRVFAECRGLTRIEIPNSVKDIGDGAFRNCYGLKNLVMPRSVFFRWDSANDRWVGRDFYDVFECLDERGLPLPFMWETVVLLDIPPTAGYEEVPDLPIATGFRDMPNLRSVSLPGCVRAYDMNAFYNCPRLESVTISGDTVADPSLPSDWWIGEWAFYGCVNLTHVDIPDGVWAIQDRAFYGCSSLKSVNIPASVAWIADEAFSACNSLASVVFLGNAPAVDHSFSGIAADCVAYILPSSTGWGVEVGEKWKGLTLLYWYYAGFPFVENDSDIVVALAGAADGRLYAMITNMAEYYAYWEWAHVVKNRVGVLAGTPAVKASPHAAAAYLLGATELFDNEPTITITELKMGPASASRLASRGVGNAMTVAVTVKDGDRPVLVDAAKVATLFEATSDLGDWDGAAKLMPSVEVLEGDAVTMRFKVTLGDGTVKRAFLRIKH
ncbi:MAG: leucine-rich repeat domain-containing protein [Kiritimatiellae bacterium]|nr:leucine-rich repeat domain-containing protein [Kiritimatiellia bacterium]